MKRTLVNSSNLKSVGYDQFSSSLEIEFHSGDIYQYHGVQIDNFEGLLNAPSLGKYFNKFIRYRFETIKVRE